jgi:hypothetical protein
MRETTCQYNNKKEMSKGIQLMTSQGWSVKSSTALGGDWKFGKTCCLGFIFLPLALLGKESDAYLVVFQRDD